MGTVISVHVIGPRSDSDVVDAAIARCHAQLRDIEAVFSPFLPGSDVSRLRRRELGAADADPRVAIVERGCREAAAATEGAFSAWWRGWFDPTGYVKGWAVHGAFQHHLEPLLTQPGVDAVGINAGGDLQVGTAPAADWTWRVGIADPRDTSALIATVDLRDGAVATSGTYERGHHIVDPRTGSAAASVLSATVVADDLTSADVWATAAIVKGSADLGWARRAPDLSGLIVAADGSIRRWIGGVPIDVVSLCAAASAGG